MLCFVWVTLVDGFGEERRDEDAFVQQRRQLRHKTRRVIFNNDGCDCLYFPKNLDITEENFLLQRTSPLVDTHVDSIFYCTISSGFSNFTHRTERGHILTRQVAEDLDVKEKINITQTLVDQGTDVLSWVVRWCHEHDKECFWSFRMNDTHDAAHKPEKPYPLFPSLKEEHPEYMIGELGRRPPYGSWTSVNYGLSEVRDLAVQFIEEVCANYDVDGIEMDFCRHLSYFPSVAFGQEATDEERNLMTDMMRQVREVCEAHGRKRERPFLIAVRVPDSLEYSKAVGLDLEMWMREDLIDLLIGGFYMRLNPWESLVQAGKRHDMTVYAGLSESRVKGDIPPFSRNSEESYRGRAHRAWEAGVDGIYLFNYFNPKAGFLREIGEPSVLDPLAKIYYATVRNRNPNSYLKGGDRFLNVAMITPQNPLHMVAGQVQKVDLYVGKISRPERGGTREVKLYVCASGEAEFGVAWNGTSLDVPVKEDAWLVYPMDPLMIHPGKNQMEFRSETGPTTLHDLLLRVK